LRPITESRASAALASYVTMEPTSSTTQEAFAEAGADAGTVSIELDFKAFADHVPPTEHARRAPGHGDPSVQDFADQALELAALHAELNRLARSHEILQQQALAREARLDALRAELSSTRKQLREALRESRDKGSVEEATLALETPRSRAHRRSLLPLRGESQRRRGRRSSAVSPPSGRLRSVRFPPCACATSRAIDRPRPVPPVSRLREDSSR